MKYSKANEICKEGKPNWEQHLCCYTTFLVKQHFYKQRQSEIDLIQKATRVPTRHNTTQDNTTQHECNTRQHEYNMTQHEYNTAQHETTRVRHETTRVQNDTTRVQHSINFTLIYLHHRCILGTWYIKAKALLMS